MSKLPPCTLAKLKKHVTAAADEFEMAVMFYEAWRTAVDDSSLACPQFG